MEWTQARDRTLVRWRRILDGIGQEDQVKLLTRLNEIAEVCELAGENADRAGGRRCDHCLVFDSDGECLEMRWRVTQALLDGELEQAKTLVQAVLARVAAARPREMSGA